VDDFVTVPEWIRKNKKYSSMMKDIRWSLGYRGMCRFRSGPLFDQPVLRGFDYAMTLDTDGYLPDALIDFDPIEKMHNDGGLYAYSHILDDQPAAVEHFYEHVLMFMRDRGIQTDKLPLLAPFLAEGKWNMRLYMNDIEIMKLDWFRGEKYRDFFNYLDSFGGWWLHRWGDHAVRTFAVGMWMNKDELVQIDIPYGHQSYCKCRRKNFVCVKESQIYGTTPFFTCVEP
jgi:alpha 1,2-mannosyltransferase